MEALFHNSSKEICQTGWSIPDRLKAVNFRPAVVVKIRPALTAFIDSNTPTVVRRSMIELFKQKKIEFLFNFGVLTTGFDAPKTDCIVIVRPTTSEVLYEQIIGRGLRGPEFGGTEECDIIDFADNIFRLGSQMAYTRFAEFWSSNTE